MENLSNIHYSEHDLHHIFRDVYSWNKNAWKRSYGGKKLFISSGNVFCCCNYLFESRDRYKNNTCGVLLGVS